MHGTRYEERAGRLTAVVDRTGRVWSELAWAPTGLTHLRVPGVVIDGAILRDDLLGDAHAIRGDDGALLTAISAVDWAAPAEVPVIAAPGRLPPGAGGALLDAIAVLAARAGVPALRYAGPYPTPALWRALGRSFRASAPALAADELEAAFTAELIPRAARLARDPIAIDFAPAPHARVAVAGGHVELRDGLERAVLEGVAYEPGGSPARLVDGHAEIWFGDAPYARAATFAPDGSLLDGPHAIPPAASAVAGAPFPAALVGALAELVADAVPPPLAADARAWIAARPIRWADLGARAAAARADELCVHTALWDRIAPLGLGRLALALAEALAPVVTGALVRAVLDRRS